MKHPEPYRLATLVLLAVAVIALTGSGSPADASSTKSRKSSGVIVEIGPSSLTLDQGEKGEVTIHTPEDYSDRVSVGMLVTAWHGDEGGVEELDRIDYPLEFSPLAPADFIPRIKRVILLPSSNAGDADALFAAVERLAGTRLNWVVAHRMLAEEVRRRAEKSRGLRTVMAASGDDSAPAALDPADAELIQKIAEASRADAVLEMRVEHTLLKVKSYTAEWDGQRETFGSKGAKIASAMTLRSVRGQVPVSTVVLKLFDSQGRLLWRNRRGFRVLALQVGMGNDFRDRPLAEAAEDSAFLRDWLTQTFASWLNPGPKPPGATAKR